MPYSRFAKDLKNAYYFSVAFWDFLTKPLGARSKWGLVLGSGAAPGLCHIGVIKVLEENGLRPDFIAGSSIGALIGAFYAAGQTPEEMTRLARQLDLKEIFSFSDLGLNQGGFIRGDKMKVVLAEILPAKTFAELKIPLLIATTDLATAKVHVITEGDLLDAVRASAAIPVLFSPVEIAGKALVDGGAASPLPINQLQKYYRAKNPVGKPLKTIAVNCLAQVTKTYAAASGPPAPAAGAISLLTPAWNKFYQNAIQTIHIMENNLAKDQAKDADILLEPIPDPPVDWLDFSRPGPSIEAGAKATQSKLKDISRLLK